MTIVYAVYARIDLSGPCGHAPRRSHRAEYKSLRSQQKRWLRRRQAVEPAIGHFKSDNRVDRYWLKGAPGHEPRAISYAAGYNMRWLLRAVARVTQVPACVSMCASYGTALI